MLESLEERLTPSAPTQTAGSYNDLVNAIGADTAANTNYVIQITNSFQFNAGAQISISQLGSGSTLTIEGSVDQFGFPSTLQGNGNRLFTIGSDQNVTFRTLELSGGTVANTSGTAQGGAILDQGGNVTLSNVEVRANTVIGATAEGGGIYLSAGGNLTVAGGSTINSNQALGHYNSNTAAGTAYGGGVYASGAGAITIRDGRVSSNLAQGGQGYNATVAGANGGSGGSAAGGGLYVTGDGWTVTLIGDTFDGDRVLAGSGGDGAAGTNATGPNTQGGNGGNGGQGGRAEGGGAIFTVTGFSTTRLTILNDLAVPITHPSLFIDNTAQAGAGGNGGDGGASAGTADKSGGDRGRDAGFASGGAICVTTTVLPPPGGFSYPSAFTVNIGNTSVYGNKISSTSGGTGGEAGSSDAGDERPPGDNGNDGSAFGGGLELGAGYTSVVNCTVANNTVTSASGVADEAVGGGIDTGTGTTLENNTITRNVLIGGATNVGSGLFGGDTLFNNVIQGNQSIGAPAVDYDTYTTPSNASNNFIGTMSPNAISTTTNIVGNPQAQLGSAVGVDPYGYPTGGPIYYPLLPGVVSLGAGTSGVLSTIAAVEGISLANVVDPIGNPIPMNGIIDLGAAQSMFLPSPATMPSPVQLLVTINLDSTALMFQNFPPVLAFLNAMSERLLGQSLPPTAELLPSIENDIAALMNLVVGTLDADIAALVNILDRSVPV